MPVFAGYPIFIFPCNATYSYYFGNQPYIRLLIILKFFFFSSLGNTLDRYGATGTKRRLGKLTTICNLQIF